jgi:MAE_28990/MAE_18760-like HEPN
MTSSDLLPFFRERFGEVDEYLNLLQDVETAAQQGPPRIEGAPSVITTSQQRILYSSVYLQLYNLVEATISRCISAITEAAALDGKWFPDDLDDALRQEWIRATARTHVDLTPRHRLQKAVEMCGYLISRLPVEEFTIEVGGGGNWDDDAIETISDRIGCRLNITPETRTGVKRPLRDDLGAMKLVKKRRNGLAHGSISFTDCADGVSIAELRTTANRVEGYLREVIDSFAEYVDGHHFIAPQRRPQPQGIAV